MTTAKLTSIQELCYPGARFYEKGCLQVWGGDALNNVKSNALLHNLLLKAQEPKCSSQRKHWEKIPSIFGRATYAH
jgi:hypothetical protein